MRMSWVFDIVAVKLHTVALVCLRYKLHRITAKFTPEKKLEVIVASTGHNEQLGVSGEGFRSEAVRCPEIFCQSSVL